MRDGLRNQAKVGMHSLGKHSVLMSALVQGLVSMHRAGVFGSDAKFRTSYQVSMDRLLFVFMEGKGVNESTRKI